MQHTPPGQKLVRRLPPVPTSRGPPHPARRPSAMRLLHPLFLLPLGLLAWLHVSNAAEDGVAAEVADPVEELCAQGVSLAAGENKDVEKALELMREAAEQGSPTCARHVGFTYFYGKGAAEVDHELGMQWYVTAGERGDVEALTHMAALYASNATYPQFFDEDLAEQYARRAADTGTPAAMRAYAALLLARDRPAEHNDWMKRCAATMDPQCMGEYGLIMAKGQHGHRLRIVKGIEMLREAARRDDGMAMMEVGKLEFKEDAQKAEPYFTRAAQKGYPGALFHLSRVTAARVDDNGFTQENDFRSEVAMLELCAKHKDGNCMHLLGLYHIFGVGTLDVDPAAGIELLLAAGRASNDQALAALSTFFIDGFYVKPDHPRALKLAQAAAALGNANAAKLVEDHSKHGGFEVRPIDDAYKQQMARKIKSSAKRMEDMPDLRETVDDLLPKLKAVDDSDLRTNMLNAHQRWINSKDPQAALALDDFLMENHHMRQSWLLMAQLAATGHAEGLFRAALKLANGIGVAKDFDTSLKYMEAASSLGHAAATKRLVEHAANMNGQKSVSPSQLHEML